MPFKIGSRVIANMRNLNPDFVPSSRWPEAPGTVIENPRPGIYHVRLDAPIENLDTLMDLGEDRLMPYAPTITH